MKNIKNLGIVSPIETVVQILARKTGVDFNDRCRKRDKVEAKQVIVYFLMKLGYKNFQVAKATGYHHATIIYAENKIQGMMDFDDKKIWAIYIEVYMAYYDHVKSAFQWNYSIQWNYSNEKYTQNQHFNGIRVEILPKIHILEGMDLCKN